MEEKESGNRRARVVREITQLSRIGDEEGQEYDGRGAGGSEEYEDTDASDEDQDEEDEEPALKYSQLPGVTPSLLLNDIASVLTYANGRLARFFLHLYPIYFSLIPLGVRACRLWVRMRALSTS